MRFNSAKTIWNPILLLVLAVVAPTIAGFQYLAWRDSYHLFIGITGSTWAILYSNWYLNDWLIILVPNIVVLIPRIFFVFSLVGFGRNRVGLNLVYVFGGLLIGIQILICVYTMTINSIFGIPPGVLISIAAPDVELRLFLPTPILFLIGMYQVWSTGYKKNEEEVS